MPNDSDELVEPLDVPLDVQEEPLEEVLHQASEQTRRLAHLDESVNELKQSTSELAETMTAGLVELRGVVAAIPAPAPVVAESTQPLAERLDELERRVGALKGRLTLVVAFAVLQLGIGGVLIAAALGFLEAEKPSAAAPTAAAVAEPQAPASPAPAAAAEPTPLKEPLKEKKKRRRQ